MIAGCVIIPLAKPSLFSGSIENIYEAVPTIKKLSDKGNSGEIKPKRETYAKLLLAGTKFEDGLVAELSRGDNEDSKGKVDKVTGRGKNWGHNGMLFSDGFDGEYTFTDNAPLEWGSGCGGYARYGEKAKVCVAHNRIVNGGEERGKNNFPKIKFDGGSTRLKGNGYSSQPTLSMMAGCTVNVAEKKLNKGVNLIATISCRDGSLVREISSADFEKMALEKH